MTVTPRVDIPGTFTVQSGTNVYDVDVRDPFTPTCSCPAGCWSNTVCKHVRACLAYAHGEPE